MKVYLSGINGIRAIAATAVVISHINLSLSKFGLPNSVALSAANFGVTIFFCLSGFLITYLLLIEKTSSSTVNIGKFYVRRILRIWPLYFLYILLVLWFTGVFDQRLLWYVLFFPNVAFVINASMPLLAHYWSLGVEEQFYIIWPWLVRYTSKLGSGLLLFILLFVSLKVVVKFAHLDMLYTFLHYSRFGCMAIGALAALCYYRKLSAVNLITHRAIQWLCWAALGFVCVNSFHIASIIDHELISLATAVIILSQVKEVAVFSLETRPLNYLGRISYGIYVFNPLVIDLLARQLGHVLGDMIWLKYVIVYSVVPSTIILVSHVSFYYYERWFLNWKVRFAIVKT